MPSHRCGALVVFAAVVASTGSAAAQPEPVVPSLSQDQVDRLNAGEILVEVAGQERPVADTIAVVEARAAVVLAVIEDFEHYTEFMPDMSEAEVVGREGDFVLCRGVTDTPWPMEDREWVVRARSGALQLDGLTVLFSDWKYVPGSGNLVDTEGYWLLVPWGDDGEQTLVRYHLIADIGSWIPDFLMNWATENMLPETIVAIRARIAASGG